MTIKVKVVSTEHTNGLMGMVTIGVILILGASSCYEIEESPIENQKRTKSQNQQESTLEQEGQGLQRVTQNHLDAEPQNE